MRGNIYSYYSEGIMETLLEHIKEALRLLSKIDNSRISRVGRSLYKNFNKLLIFSVTFHDLGKVFYQGNVYKGTMSFRGHEFFSAYIYELFRNELINIHLQDTCLEELSNTYKVVTFAILYHHHAMNLYLRKSTLLKDVSYLKRRERESIIRGFQLLNNLKEYFSLLTTEGVFNETEFKAATASLNRISSEGSNLGTFLVNVRRHLDEVNKCLWKNFTSDQKFRKLCLLTLSSLITVDYLSAIKGREETTTLFSHVLKEYYKLYMNHE